MVPVAVIAGQQPTADRQPLQVEREDDDGDEAEEELGDRYADHAGDGEDVVRRAAAAQGADGAQDGPENAGEHQRDDRELELAAPPD